MKIKWYSIIIIYLLRSSLISMFYYIPDDYSKSNQFHTIV